MKLPLLSVILITAYSLSFGAVPRVATGHFPDLAVDTQGNLHLVYNHNGLKYKKYSASQKTWSAEQDPDCDCQRVERSDPDIVIDSHNNPHVFCGADYAYWSGSKWVKVPLPGYCRDSELAIDGNNNVYLHKRGGENGGGYIGFFRKPAGGSSWTAMQDPDAGSIGKNDHVYPDMAISPVDNSIHLVQRHGNVTEVTHRVSMNGGASWPIKNDISSDREEGPHIVVDYDNNVYITTGKGFFWEKLPGGRWGWTTVAVEAGSRKQPELSVDRNNNIYVSCYGGRYNVRENGVWIGRNHVVPKSSSKSMIGFAETAGFMDHGYIAWEEDDFGNPDSGLTENAEIFVGRLYTDGVITGLNEPKPGIKLNAKTRTFFLSVPIHCCDLLGRKTSGSGARMATGIKFIRLGRLPAVRSMSK